MVLQMISPHETMEYSYARTVLCKSYCAYHNSLIHICHLYLFFVYFPQPQTYSVCIYDHICIPDMVAGIPDNGVGIIWVNMCLCNLAELDLLWYMLYHNNTLATSNLCSFFMISFSLFKVI